MKLIYKYFVLLLFYCITIQISGCKEDRGESLLLTGDTKIESITISGQDGIIDQKNHKIVVNLPVDQKLSSVSVDDIILSEGASCDYPIGTIFDGTIPRSIRVTNGDLFANYALNVAHDNVQFISFNLDNKYQGTIDNEARTVVIFVPIDTDLSAMHAYFTMNEGTTANYQSGAVIDFSEPVIITLTLRSAVIPYTIKVIKDEMSQAPKAFVGNKPSVDQLDNESRTACQWMLDNVPNSHYISIQSIIDGEVNLADYKMIWCHFDWTDWPSQLWDSRDKFNSYWLRGGAILATRDGMRYINDVWRIARDQQSPNNMFGGDGYETLTYDLGFTIQGHEDHPLYKNLKIEGNSRILLLSVGCAYTNRTLQWAVDWSPYGSLEGWRKQTGAKELASGNQYDINRVTIAEFEPYEALKGFSSGRVITIGTPAYEWYDNNNSNNLYRDNIITLTKNAINYLCK